MIGDAGKIDFGRTLADAGYDDAGSIAQVDLLNLLTLVQSTPGGDTGIDTLSGGQGNDIVIGGGKGDTLYGDAETDGTDTPPFPDSDLADFERPDVGRDLLIGDNGRIDFEFGFLVISDPLNLPARRSSRRPIPATPPAAPITPSAAAETTSSSAASTATTRPRPTS